MFRLDCLHDVAGFADRLQIIMQVAVSGSLVLTVERPVTVRVQRAVRGTCTERQCISMP